MDLKSTTEALKQNRRRTRASRTGSGTPRYTDIKLPETGNHHTGACGSSSPFSRGTFLVGNSWVPGQHVVGFLKTGPCPTVSTRGLWPCARGRRCCGGDCPVCTRVRACVCACVHMCVRSRVCLCVRAYMCVLVCSRVYVCVCGAARHVPPGASPCLKMSACSALGRPCVPWGRSVFQFPPYWIVFFVLSSGSFIF